MALQANKTTGKAVADIKALYFLRHENGVEKPIVESIDSKDWFPVLTLRGTVNAGQDAPSIEKINVDQFDAPIGITSEPGDFTFEAQIPSFTYEDTSKWISEESGNIEACIDDEGDPVLINGRQLMGINLNGDLYETSVMVQTRTGATIIFTNAQVSLTFGKEDKVFIFRVNGQILAPSNSKNKMMYIATENVISKSSATSEEETESTGE